VRSVTSSLVQQGSRKVTTASGLISTCGVPRAHKASSEIVTSSDVPLPDDQEREVDDAGDLLGDNREQVRGKPWLSELRTGS
jgi:hypothetical protein